MRVFIVKHILSHGFVDLTLFDNFQKAYDYVMFLLDKSYGGCDFNFSEYRMYWYLKEKKVEISIVESLVK